MSSSRDRCSVVAWLVNECRPSGACVCSMIGIGLLTACSFEPPSDLSIDAGADATPDATTESPDADLSCETDSFDGTTLQSHWTLLTGELPTYDVSGSRLLISDAATATTPSRPTYSWIYDLDSDEGNQIGWAQAVGGADFVIDAEIAWSSSTPELTMGGVAVADSGGTMAAMAGFVDGSETQLGFAHAQMATSGTDAVWYGPTGSADAGNANVRLERRAGTLRISVDGSEVLSGPSAQLISYVTIYTVRFRNGQTTYPYGGVELRTVTVCR